MKSFSFFTLSGLLYCMSGFLFAENQTASPSEKPVAPSNLTQLTSEPTAQQTPRQIYRKIQQLLTRSQSQATLQIVQPLLVELQSYPLYPYAQYSYLKANKTALRLDMIEDYQQQYPDLPFAIDLKKVWLQQAQTQQNWSSIIENQASLPSDRMSRCIILQAEYNSQPTLSVTTHPMWYTQVEQLWLTGESLPKQCDPLLAQWIEMGQLTDELIKARAVLAFEQKNQGLLSYLQQQAKKTEIKQWVSDLSQLINTPLQLQQPHSIFYPPQIAPTDTLAKRVVLQHFPLLIKNLKENTFVNQSDPFATYEAWSKALKLSAEETKQWKKILISHLFDSDDNSLQQWRDTTLVALKDDGLTERRIRTALREKKPLMPWLNLLSDNAKNKDEWRYWQAYTLAQHAETKNQAQSMLATLAKQRGFYPMLASTELGIPYRPEMLTFVLSKATSIPSIYAGPLARINELRELNDESNMNLEWKTLLDKSSFEQKLALASYATQQAWFDLAVEATIQAKAWGYIALRLPKAYMPWFDLHLNNKNIDRTFAMAIARQESAWKHNASSHANARGLMQLLPSTAKQTAQQAELPYTHESQLFDPFDNIMLGSHHLQELYDKYGNNRILIAAAYNAGASRVDRWLMNANGKLTMAEFIASIPFYETRGYVQNVLTYDLYYQILQNRPQQTFSQDEYNRLY